MPPGLSFALNVAALLLFVITPIVWEAVCRLRAGPVRFRLAIASPADRSQVNATWSFVLIFFFWGPFGIPIVGDFWVTRLLMPMLWFWLCSAALLQLRRN